MNIKAFSLIFVVAVLVCYPLHTSCLGPVFLRPQELTAGEDKASSQTAYRARAQETPENNQPGHPVFSTVVSSELPKRPISLAECIALALERGRTGDYFDAPGQRMRSSVSGLRLATSPSSATDSIRVFAHDPAIAAAEAEEMLSRFDVWSESSLFWNRIDQPSRLLSASPFEDFSTRNKVDGVNFRTGLYKRLSTGGFAGMQFLGGHEDNFVGANSQILNPGYRPSFNLLFEQPLLQGAGVLINQLRDFHPGSIRQTFPDSGKPPGILLVRISERQTQLEFERQVHELVFRVEEAYWQLYGAYWDLYSSDNGMKQAHAAWQIAKARYDAGGIGIEDLSMIEEQYHFFRTQRLQALGRGQPGRPGVLEAERQLRFVIGLTAEDGTRLIPTDQPHFVAYEPDLHASMTEAQTFRPELRQVEEAVRAARLLILKAQDRLKPDLRLVSTYGLNGLGETVGQGLEDVTTNPNHEWEVGLRMQFPLGYRGGHAETARANLQMTQTLIFLEDQQEKLLFSLQRGYRDLIQNQEQYKIRQSQRVAASKQLQARYEKYKAGGDPKQPGMFIDLLLRAQRNWVDALREEYAALCDYRTAIADFERQKGTILQYANVTIATGPAPAAVIPHASKHLRERHQRRLEGAAPEAYFSPPDLDAVEPIGAPAAVALPAPTEQLGVPLPPATSTPTPLPPQAARLGAPLAPAAAPDAHLPGNARLGPPTGPAQEE